MHLHRKMAGDIRQRMLVFSAHVRHAALSEALVLLANSDNPLPDTKKEFLDRSIYIERERERERERYREREREGERKRKRERERE